MTIQTVTQISAAARGNGPLFSRCCVLMYLKTAGTVPARNVGARIVFALMTLTGAGRGSAASVAMVTVWIWLSS